MVYRTYKSLSKYDEFSGDYIYYDKPQYSLDIYKWDGSSAKRILNKECVSVYFDDDTVFYLLLKRVKTTNLCTNNYDMENKYSFTANSKEYKLKKERSLRFTVQKRSTITATSRFILMTKEFTAVNGSKTDIISRFS